MESIMPGGLRLGITETSAHGNIGSSAMSAKNFLSPCNSTKLRAPTSQRPLEWPSNSFPFSVSIFPKTRVLKAFPVPQSHSGDQTPRNLAEAQESVTQFLRELGLSPEDSLSIASSSPKYAQMLADGAAELEEWSSWNQQGGELGFKETMLLLAREKGDNGKVAFLESLGFSLSSAMFAARYSSSDSLPTLINKVKYMKEVLFSGSDDKPLLGKNARRMMMHLSVAADDHLQQTLSFFEKIEARRGGLSRLGLADASFKSLVESFPQILSLSVESHLKPLVRLLEDFGVPKDSIGDVLLLFPPITFWNTQDIRAKVLFFQMVGAAGEDVGKMLLKYPWILSASVQENYEHIVSLFDEEKVPRKSLESAIRSWPHFLGCSKGQLKWKVKQLSELGVRNKKLGLAIAKSPQLLLQKPQELVQVVLFLEGLGFDRENIGKILCRCPEIFASSVSKTLKKKVEFINDLGISKDHLPRVIKKYPEFLVSDVERTLLPRVKFFTDIGLSKRDISFMVRRFSPLLGYSIDQVLEPKLEFLVNTMERPIKEIVDYPRYFSYSLEKKIKPRFWILKGRNIECSLKDMLGKNDEEFAAEYMGIGRILVPP